MRKEVNFISQIQSPLIQYSKEVIAHRKADYPIHPLFLNRWSPRSFSTKKVKDDILYTVLEAARWAPSANNAQPWRFFIAKTQEQRELFQQFISERNRLWSDKAPVLILLASQKIKEDDSYNPFHAFDTGAAWASLALQAHLLGLSTRAIGGFNVDKARKTLNIQEEFDLHIVIALGFQDEKDALTEENFRELEKPNQRHPLSESIF